MLKQAIALFAPVALIVAATACSGESPLATGEDGKTDPQASGTGNASGGDPQLGSSRSELRGGRGGGGDRDEGDEHGGRGGEARGEGDEHGFGGGDFRGGGDGRGPRGGVRHGWVNGRWAPGWGWSHGQWIVGGGDQFTCVTDVDCAGPLGPNVAVCSFDPTAALGYCIAPNW